MNDKKAPVRILFTGYAKVHFVCFKPLYECLVAKPNVEVFVSGGLRTKVGNKYQYDPRAMYQDFGVTQDRILTVDEIKHQHFDLLFAGNTKMIKPKSVKKKIQIFHGISFRNKAIRQDNLNSDYFFIAGPYMHRKFQEAGLLEASDPRAIPIGFMKTDRLVNGGLDRSELLKQSGFSGNKPILLYAPTGNKNNSMEIMGEEIVEKICATKKYDLVIKLHDHPKRRDINWSERLEPYLGPHFKLSQENDVIRLLALADLLISDASSVSNEYALLDRPMVFLDTPQLISKAKQDKDAIMDIDTWGRKGGVVVERPDQIANALESSLTHPMKHSPIRQAMSKDLFYNPGHATQAAVSWLEMHFL